MPSKLLDRLIPIRGLGYNFHVLLILYQDCDSFAQQGMVINGQDPN
jgi:hypothetical protein